jgi:hypothetical protein
MTDIIKCSVEDCNNPTTRELYVEDSETVTKVYLCLTHWNEAHRHEN